MNETLETTIRAFELPIQSIEIAGADSKAGWKLLRDCWQQATMLANWGVDQLMRQDRTRLPSHETWADLRDFPVDPNVPPLYNLFNGMVKQAKAKKGQPTIKRTAPVSFSPGYPGREFFAGQANAVQTIFNAVSKKYKDERYRVLWLRRAKFSGYRYPYPWPVGAKSVMDIGFDNDKPWVKVALPGGHVVLHLRGGSEFGRQMGHFRRLAADMAAWKAMKPRDRPKSSPCKQMVIIQQGASGGCHRPTMQDHGRTQRVMLKMVADMPIREKTGNRTLVLLTDPEAFWVAELDGRQAWILNADDVRRGCEAHKTHLRRIQRFAEDLKAERRLDPVLMGNREMGKAIRKQRKRRQQQRRSDALCHKHDNVMASWTHETAAHLVGFCTRQGVSEVLYLDRDKGFIPKFPWHQLHSKLSDKLRLAGIALYTESGVGDVANDEASEVCEDGEMSAPDIRPTNPEEESTWDRVTKLREMAARKVTKVLRQKKSHPAVSAP